MPDRFTQHRRVAFSETDLAGIVHFSNFYRYMEDCEHAFFRSLGESVDAMPDGEGGTVGWPRVSAECRFHRPLKFEDEFEAELLVERVGNKSLSYRIRFWGGEGRKLLAEGKVVAVCARLGGGAMRSVEIPARIREKIEEAPPELLAAPAESR